MRLSNQAFGEEHPNTLVSQAIRKGRLPLYFILYTLSQGNLAQLLSQQGKKEQATQVLAEQLSTSRRVLGDRHPHTLASLSNLAYLLYAGGKHEEAEPLLREEVDATSSVLGSQHPETITAVRRLADGLEKRGMFDEALSICSSHFGPLHPRSLGLFDRMMREAHAAA